MAIEQPAQPPRAPRPARPAAPTPDAAASAASSSAGASAGAALIQEAAKKAAVAWVAVGDGQPVALWCVPLDDALYVISGPGEQAAPGLATATAATVTLRGDHGGRIVSWPASVSRVDPAGELWETAAPLVASKRLNAPGDTAGVVRRWVAECVLSRLSLAADTLTAGDALPDGSLAQPPRPSPAARPSRAPFRLHRVRRR